MKKKQNNRIIDSVEQVIEQKIQTILGIGLVSGHDTLILSAFGCGAFRCPPLHMAEIFKRVIESEEFRGQFKNIVFAIIDDHNSRKEHNPEGNIKPFADVFQVSVQRIQNNKL